MPALGLAALVPVALSGGLRPALAALPWLLATLAATMAWARARNGARGRLRASSSAFIAAGAVGVVGHLAWTYEGYLSAPAGVPAGVYLLVLPHLLLTLGAVLALAAREPGATGLAVVADVVLLELAALVGLLRWVVEPRIAAGEGHGALMALAVLQSVAVVPVLPAALVLLQRRAWLLPRAAALLLAATLLFATTGLLALSGADPRPLVRGDVLDGLPLAGWVLLAMSGLAAGGRPRARSAIAGRRLRDRLRNGVVPAVALFLGVVAVDAAVGPEPRTVTVATLMALVLVLTLRTAHAFRVVDREVERGERLAHTHALVEVTHALAGTTDLDETLRVISESTRGVLGTRAAGIELVADDGHELVTRAAVGLPPEVLGLRFPVEGSFTGWVVRNGEPRATVDPSVDPYVQPQSLVFLGSWPVAAAPIRFRGETLGALFACIRAAPFEPEELRLIGALAEQAAIAIQNARLFEQVMVLSITDPLTGLANRRQLERELAREFAAAGRGRDLVAVIFDLDGFKAYNDAHGHLAGDEALQAFAATLQAETRAMNFAARYGGDEFVALLGGADADGARAFIQRIRDRFRIASLALGRGEITVSAGMAEWAPDVDRPDQLLRQADDELYRRKSRLRT